MHMEIGLAWLTRPNLKSLWLLSESDNNEEILKITIRRPRPSPLHGRPSQHFLAKEHVRICTRTIPPPMHPGSVWKHVLMTMLSKCCAYLGRL